VIVAPRDADTFIATFDSAMPLNSISELEAEVNEDDEIIAVTSNDGTNHEFRVYDYNNGTNAVFFKVLHPEDVTDFVKRAYARPDLIKLEAFYPSTQVIIPVFDKSVPENQPITEPV
jgi:hypothetical protein